MGPAVILWQDSKFFLSYYFLRNKTSQVDRKRKMHLELNLANFLTNSSKIDGHLETTSSRRLSLHRASLLFRLLLFSFFFYLHKHDWNINVFLKLSIMLPISITCTVFDKHGGFFCSVSTRIWCDLSATGLGAVWALSVACREGLPLEQEQWGRERVPSMSTQAWHPSRRWGLLISCRAAGGQCAASM